MNLVVETICGLESKLCNCDFEIKYQELDKGIGKENTKDGEKIFFLIYYGKNGIIIAN